MLADDLGYAELGSYGQQKIRTPSLDRLAAEGVRFTQHYSGNAVCAPSRSVLLTGRHPGRTPIRDNREAQPEGQAPLPGAAVTLAELFKKEGYVTGAMGKWGLGPPGSEGDPLRQGFDRFFGYNCQRQAHNSYPAYLYDDELRLPLDNPPFPAHQKLSDGADPDDPRSYAGYAGGAYAPDLTWERAREFIRDNRHRPFFLYLPTTVPHLALQVPEDSLAEYRGLWPDPPYRGDQGYLPHPAPRAAYAAMVTRMDREVGRITRPRPRPGPRRANDRGVHVGQRADLRPPRRLGLRVLPLGRPVPRPQGLALRGRRPRARDREVAGAHPRRDGQRARDRVRGLAADAARAGRSE